MKAFERMEKLQQRRQEHQAKQAHRRESEPCPGKEDDKNETKIKRRRFVLNKKYLLVKIFCQLVFEIKQKTF